MEARGIRLQGERGISRQPIAQGMPECSGCTCMLVCAFLRKHCTRDRGCSKHPAFPAPSVLRDKVHANLGRSAPREGEVMFTSADANKFATPDNEHQQRDVTSACSSFVLRNVFSKHAFVALQSPFAIRALGKPVGNSDLRVHRTGTERDAGLITGGDDFLQAKLAVAENGDESNEHDDLR